MAEGKISVLIEAVNRTREATQGAEADLERLRRARLDNSKLVLEEQRAQRYLTQVYRVQHQGFMDTISVMRNVGSIGRSVLSMWQAYTIGQIHSAEAIRSVQEAQIAANTALELYGANSVVYQDAAARLDELRDAAENARGNETMGLIGLGLSAVGVAAQVGTLLAKLELLGAVGAISIPIAFAITGAAALQQAIEYVSHPTTETAPGGTAADYPRGFIPGEYLDVSQRMELPSGVGGQKNINITQINYGVGFEEAGQRFIDMVNEIFNSEEP